MLTEEDFQSLEESRYVVKVGINDKDVKILSYMGHGKLAWDILNWEVTVLEEQGKAQWHGGDREPTLHEQKRYSCYESGFWPRKQLRKIIEVINDIYSHPWCAGPGLSDNIDRQLSELRSKIKEGLNTT